MKSNLIRVFFITLILVGYLSASIAQSPESLTDEKRERKKSLTVREYNTDAKGKNSWLDHLTVYNEKGFKIEEIEYATYGMVSRILSEYDANDRCVKEIVYDDRNKVSRIRKYEYNEDGTKKKQYNYLPNGRLYSTKVFEYTYK